MIEKKEDSKLSNNKEYSFDQSIKIEILDRNEKLIFVMDRIRAAGFEVYVVGGSVRDALLGIEPEDFDIATSASWETLCQLFPKTKKLGKQFGRFGTVQIVHNGFSVDAATFRTESAYKDFRKPDEIQYIGSIYEDLERRDFTINAMAYSNREGLLDKFDGLKDLKNKKIKTVLKPKERFTQDALRILRAIRFSGQLGLGFEEKTLEAMKETAYLVSFLPKDRVRQELQKAILSKNPSLSLKAMIEVNLFEYMGAPFSKKLSENETENLLKLSLVIDESECNFDKRMVLILKELELERSKDLAEYLKVKKTIRAKYSKA